MEDRVKIKWHKGGEKPPKSGPYLVAFVDPGEKHVLDINACYYYRKSQQITWRESNLHGTLEERLLDTILNPDNKVLADHDGFYESDSDGVWEIAPDFWAELPMPPKGYEYWDGEIG